MKGPKVSAPHRPMITLGMPASSSRKMPTTLASRRGSRSTMTSAAPTDTGTAMISAIAEVTSVPRISGRAPNCSPGLWVRPTLLTGVPYWEPKFHVVPVKKCRALNLIAGIASTISATSTNPSIRTGTTAPPRPSQRITAPVRKLARSAAPSRRRSGEPAPPAGPAVGAEAAIRSSAERADQGLGDRLHVRGQRLEGDRGHEVRALAGGDHIAEECLDCGRLGLAGLALLHDRVLVVDDRVAA